MVLGLLLGSGISAMADITWTLQNVTFNNGNRAVGSFVTNGSFGTHDAVNRILSFNIIVEGPASVAAFKAAGMVDSYLPNTIGIFSSGWSAYVDLYPGSPLTSQGGTIFLTGQDAYGDKYGVDCPGCGVISDPKTAAVTAPEPSAILILGAFAGVLGSTFRRRGCK